MAARNPITVPLPADLPTDWTVEMYVAPNGADVNLSQQHGYIYLMQQVNAAQQALQQVAQYFPQLATLDDAGGFIKMTSSIPVSQRKPRNLYGKVVADFTKK